jgi:hypothetical protein
MRIHMEIEDVVLKIMIKEDLLTGLGARVEGQVFCFYLGPI